MSLANTIAYYLILVTVVFTALAYGAVHPPIIALFYLTVAAIVLLWTFDGMRSGKLRFSKDALQLPIYAIALYGFIQSIGLGTVAIADVGQIPRTISLDPYSTQVSALHFLALGLFFSVTLSALDRARRIRGMVNLIIVFGFLFAFFAILQGVLSPTKIYGLYEREFAQPYGSFVNRHNFAAYMEMTVGIPLAMVLTGATKRDQRLLYLTVVLLMAIALFLSGSRGGLVALAAEALLLILMTAKVRTKAEIFLRLFLAGALLVLVVAGTIFVGGESSLSRIAETASSGDVTSNRTHIWAVTFKVIEHNFPLGDGLGAFGVAYTPFDDTSGLERVEQAHNDYLQTLADAGIVGALIGGSFLVLVIRKAIRNVGRHNPYRRAVAIGSAAGIFAVLVHSAFDFVLHTTAVAVLFLVLTALLVAAGYKYPDDIHANEPSLRRPRGIVRRFTRRLTR